MGKENNTENNVLNERLSQIQLRFIHSQKRFQNRFACYVTTLVFIYVGIVTYLGRVNLDIIAGVVIGYASAIIQFYWGSSSNNETLSRFQNKRSDNDDSKIENVHIDLEQQILAKEIELENLIRDKGSIDTIQQIRKQVKDLYILKENN